MPIIKKFFIFAALFSITGCLTAPAPKETIRSCPLIRIENQAYAKVVRHFDTYQIAITGYDSDCIVRSSGGKVIVVIQPQFVIRRLQPGGEEDVPFDYYISTPYETKKEHLTASFPEYEKEIVYEGRPVRLKMPYNLRHEIPIYLGLIINPEEQVLNNIYFDANFNYSEENRK